MTADSPPPGQPARNDGALVVVIDDDQAVCAAISRLLVAQGRRVRTYTNPRRYLGDSDALNPICILADIRMPELDGLSLLRALRVDGTDVPTVFMTATGDVPTIVSAMKEGAVDLLAKPFSDADLTSAIDRAIVSSKRVDHDRRALAALWRTVGSLTPREAEVCGLVACGLLNKRVAAAIGTKEKTVKVHRGRVMQKLAVDSVPQLVRLVDALLREAGHRTIRLDTVEVARPRSADIVIDVVTRQRAHVSAIASNEVSPPTLLDGPRTT
jgi:FixJ family two-component response regulator